MPHPTSRGAEVLAALRACRLWRAASDDAVAELARGARIQDVDRGAVLVREGGVAERFGVVVIGRAKVYHLAADGRVLTFETVGAGEPVAAVAVLAGTRYPATVEAATAVTVAWLERDDIFELLEAQPGVARSIITELASRVVNMTAVATSLSMDVPSRVAAYLFQRSLSVGHATSAGLVVDLGMTKAELASSLGTVPETLSRALARLRDDGILEVRSRDVVVLDVGALARLGSGYSEE